MSRYLFLSLSLVSFMSAASLDAPVAPSNLALIPDVHSVELSWKDNSNNETGFKIFRDGKLIKRVGENVTSYKDENLSADTEYKYEVKATNDLPLDVIKSIVDRHNYYRHLDFKDSNLVWDKTLADHAQQWADYLATHYTQADIDAGIAPHASKFNSKTHGLPYLGEGENIAWASYGLKYVRNKPVDITVAHSAEENYEFGAVDMWANEKTYYDYDTNSGHGHTVGHYTQVVWQKTTKVGCGKAHSTTDITGDHIVCRYQIPGNWNGEKPYCSNYTISDLYIGTNLKFSNELIKNASFNLVKIYEDRHNCTRNDKPDSHIKFTGVSSASIPQFNVFNTSDGSNLWDMNFNKIEINSSGKLIMSNLNNENNGDNRYMTMKIVGETSNYYSVEAYWWVVGSKYERRAILKLMK